ncbi:hypothetical protein HG537_0A04260 [Torulaspora globosa]|uniref:Ribosomal protein S2 n=1 Tax=Torulaspora globosa TaxID=48254 RepID=A0A7H9HLI5_9SACH|nr:hypothetical protein HG537_0A04260 [Torulaspora sp. CBS 2947]
MSLVISTRGVIPVRILLRKLWKRSQSTSTSGKSVTDSEEIVENATDYQKPVMDEVFSLRQKQFNDTIVEQLKILSQTNLDEVGKLGVDLNRPLTPREKQLDEELTDFLRKYSQSNKLINTDENVQDNDQRSIDVAAAQNKKYPYLIPSARGKPYTSQELFLRQMKHASHTAKLGAYIEKVYFPHKDIEDPPVAEKMSINKLLAAGVHLGQSTSLWRPSTQPFIYGEYRGIHIIDLNKTLAYLRRAAKVVEGVAERGGIVLFLGTREGQKRGLEEAAKKSHGFYISTRWIPGTLTNSTEISGVWERHEVDFADKPTGRVLTPDESLAIVKPDLLVVLNPTENRNALNEAMQVRVPTIGIIDTDSEPSLVTYPIPGNDDSLRSVNLLLGVLARAGQRGVQNRLQKVAQAQQA